MRRALPPTICEAAVRRVTADGEVPDQDCLAVEAPLEFRVTYPSRTGAGRSETTLSITMRTPGNDRDLAVGFLCTEGVVAEPGEVLGVRHGAAGDVVTVDLRAPPEASATALERRTFVNSSCGVCGKTSLAAVRTVSRHAIAPPAEGLVIPARVVHALPARLREVQAAFDRTGGLHAAALFDREGSFLVVREDVGRHNAVDKVIGAMLLEGRLPLTRHGLLVSGRVSFELVQKARMAGVALLAAVGAPSSLAVSHAQAEGMSVLGFVRDGRFNVYAGGDRVRERVAE